MPFKVRAKIVAFLGDEEKYPCHFAYKVGDEIIWDGEKFVGRICPYILPELATKVLWLFAAGPRYKEISYYFPFWYASPSIKDPSRKKYDGIGFKPVLKSQEPYPGIPPGAFQWPPSTERLFEKVTLVCPDTRTAVLFRLEAFELADRGDAMTYFRRQMVLLDRILRRRAIEIDKILGEFTEEEKYEIYPPLSPILVKVLLEELILLNYVKMKNGRVYVTEKGKKKLESFKETLSEEEKYALRLM